MIECEETALEFFIAHQQFAKSVEPAMADLHNPSPRPLARVPFLGIVLVSAARHMWNVIVAIDDIERRVAAISSIQAQMLGAALRRYFALDHDGRQYLIELRHVMPVRPGHDERQGDATAVDQQVSLAAIFFPGQSGCDRPALVPAGP